MSLHLHAHQVNYLVEHLRTLEKPEGFGEPVEGRDDLVRAPKSFLPVSFIPKSKFDCLRPKQQERWIDHDHEGSPNVVVLQDNYCAKFPTGVPGMPNVIRKADLDVALDLLKKG